MQDGKVLGGRAAWVGAFMSALGKALQVETRQHGPKLVSIQQMKCNVRYILKTIINKYDVIILVQHTCR
jgi:hypothetical protein